MPKTLTMTFRRKDYTQRGCLEYSWVPEGKRRVIVLNPGVPQHVQTDSVSDDLNASHVQVYVMNNGHASASMWQFPPGPPRPHLLQSALVDIHAPLQATGTVNYSGGTPISDTRVLDDYPRECPTGL